MEEEKGRYVLPKLPKLLGGLALIALAAGVHEHKNQQAGTAKPDVLNNPIVSTEIPEVTEKTQRKIQKTIEPNQESNQIIDKERLNSILKSFSLLKKKNIKNKVATSIIEFLKEQNVDINELEKLLAEAIKHGDQQAFLFTQNFSEELLEGHGFVSSYGFRSERLIMDPSEEGGTFEGSAEEYRKREADMTEYMEEILGIPEEIQYANKIAIKAKKYYDELVNAEDPNALNVTMSSFARMLSLFYEKLEKTEYREDVITSFCNASGISRNDMADKTKSAIAYWKSSVLMNTESAKEGNITKETLDNLENLEAILRE